MNKKYFLFLLTVLVSMNLFVSNVFAVYSESKSNISMRFENTDIDNVLDFLGEATGMIIIKDPDFRDKISINTKVECSSKEALELLNTVICFKGYTMVRTGKIIRIIPLENAKQTNIKIQKESEELREDQTVITQLVRLKYANVYDIFNIIKSLISDFGEILIYEKTNTILITDASANVKKLMEIIKELDVDSKQKIKIKMFKLVNISPKEVEQVIKQLAMTKREAIQEQNVDVKLDVFSMNLYGSIKTVAHGRTKTLIVASSEKNLTLIQSIIKEVDKEEVKVKKNIKSEEPVITNRRIMRKKTRKKQKEVKKTGIKRGKSRRALKKRRSSSRKVFKGQEKELVKEPKVAIKESKKVCKPSKKVKKELKETKKVIEAQKKDKKVCKGKIKRKARIEKSIKKKDKNLKARKTRTRRDRRSRTDIKSEKKQVLKTNQVDKIDKKKSLKKASIERKQKVVLRKDRQARICKSRKPVKKSKKYSKDAIIFSNGFMEIKKDKEKIKEKPIKVKEIKKEKSSRSSRRSRYKRGRGIKRKKGQKKVLSSAAVEILENKKRKSRKNIYREDLEVKRFIEQEVKPRLNKKIKKDRKLSKKELDKEIEDLIKSEPTVKMRKKITPDEQGYILKETLYRKGIEFYKKGNYKGAIREFAPIMSIDPKYKNVSRYMYLCQKKFSERINKQMDLRKSAKEKIQNTVKELSTVEMPMDAKKDELLALKADDDIGESYYKQQIFKDRGNPKDVSEDRIEKRRMNKVTGKIIEVSKVHEFVVLDIGKLNKVISGMIFRIYRDNEFIGKLTINEVDDHVSGAIIISKKEPGLTFKSGDIVIAAD
jgi:hypothetical protein